ncbi:hypothetical protein M9H77_15861 [Catharanthus roseus]|uniref:Uncharacterized protein n=1 Tax=Catharanthus roseus TaxID=4058 RepID=A0ACC0B155_CATRO|nr:hypothetical protein M9H77_15861 [Catharanthus roseus]
MFSTMCYMFIRDAYERTISDLGEWIHLKRGVVLWRVWPNWSMWTPYHALRCGRPPCGEPRGSDCYGNRAIVWCLTGIDYKKPKLGSNDLIILWDSDFLLYSCFSTLCFLLKLTQNGQRYNKPLKFGVEFLVQVSMEGHFSTERHADTLLSRTYICLFNLLCIILFFY